MDESNPKHGRKQLAQSDWIVVARIPVPTEPSTGMYRRRRPSNLHPAVDSRTKNINFAKLLPRDDSPSMLRTLQNDYFARSRMRTFHNNGGLLSVKFPMLKRIALHWQRETCEPFEVIIMYRHQLLPFHYNYNYVYSGPKR